MPAVFVLPSTVAGQQGPVAALLSTAGWASAAERVVGASWIVNPTGVIDPAEARRRGTAPHLSGDVVASWRRRVPTVAKTALKDLRQAHRARRFHVDPDGPWRDRPVDFVWQRHELFHTAGLDLADDLGVPSVLFAPATAVWEARRWGVRRPGWGPWLERAGEVPALRRADLVAAGAPEVAEQVARLGVDPARILVVPTGVDLDRFAGPVDRAGMRTRLGLDDAFVVGWVGSFRPFHALDRLVDAVAGLEGVALLLVGDGPERAEIERRAAARGVRAHFTGTVAYEDLPLHLAAMDCAAVVAPPDGAFHYSPLKLGEYLAAGLPVVAPLVPTVTDRLRDGVDGLLVGADDQVAVARAVADLRDDPVLRARLAAGAREAARDRWSWDDQVRRVVAALGDRAGPTGRSGA